MFRNAVLFQGFGVSWTLVKCFAVAGAVLIGAAAVLFVVLVRHLKVHSYRLSPQQSLQLMMDPGGTSPLDDRYVGTMSMRGNAVGVGIKMQFTIDSLRNAARRGDWLTFWGQPSMACSWFVGMWMLLTIILIKVNVPVIVQIVTTSSVGLLVGVILFMSWAAIYTKIDLGTDTDASLSDQVTATPAERAARVGAPAQPVFTPTVVDPFEPPPAKRRP